MSTVGVPTISPLIIHVHAEFKLLNFELQTIFEINSTAKNVAHGIMQSKRKLHSKVISKNQQKLKEKKMQKESTRRVAMETADDEETEVLVAGYLWECGLLSWI